MTLVCSELAGRLRKCPSTTPILCQQLLNDRLWVWTAERLTQTHSDSCLEKAGWADGDESLRAFGLPLKTDGRTDGWRMREAEERKSLQSVKLSNEAVRDGGGEDSGVGR